MDINSTQYQAAGFFSSSSIGFIHFGDIAMAILLGFFGAAGAFLFKLLMDKFKK